VVESLEDKKRHVAPATARVSSLEDIAIFTMDEEVPLGDIFFKIHEGAEGKETLSHKAPANELKDFFRELVPEYDEDRVYVSDIKKVLQWYNQLHQHELLEVVKRKKKGNRRTAQKILLRTSPPPVSLHRFSFLPDGLHFLQAHFFQ
jgi:hypothetical protein